MAADRWRCPSRTRHLVRDAVRLEDRRPAIAELSRRCDQRLVSRAPSRFTTAASIAPVPDDGSRNISPSVPCTQLQLGDTRRSVSRKTSVRWCGGNGESARRMRGRISTRAGREQADLHAGVLESCDVPASHGRAVPRRMPRGRRACNSRSAATSRAVGNRRRVSCSVASKERNWPIVSSSPVPAHHARRTPITVWTMSICAVSVPRTSWISGRNHARGSLMSVPSRVGRLRPQRGH